MTEPDSRWRARARQALNRYFQERSSTRLIITLILIVTGSVGFIISVLLLHGGLTQMWIRYPVSVFGAYGVFLGLIRLWVQFEKSRFDPTANEIEAALESVTSSSVESSWKSRYGHRSWFDWLDPSGVFEADEGCGLLILLAAIVIGLVAILVFVVASAPALLAEVFIDAFVLSVLYRRLRVAAKEHWLGTAIRKTILQACMFALLLSLAGWCLEFLAPGSHSIGPAIQQLLNGRP